MEDYIDTPFKKLKRPLSPLRALELKKKAQSTFNL